MSLSSVCYHHQRYTTLKEKGWQTCTNTKNTITNRHHRDTESGDGILTTPRRSLQCQTLSTQPWGPPPPRVHPGPPTRLLFSSSWAFLNSCSKEQSSSLKRPTSSQFFRNLVGVGVWSESRGRRSVTGVSLQCMVDGSKFLHTIPCPTATHTLPALQL